MNGDAANAEATRAKLIEMVRASPMMSRLDGPDDWRAFFAARWPFRDPGETEHLIQALRKAGVPV